ncbi:MAG: diaminopimelate epimerase [Myxococcales bacterium]
MTFSFFKYEGLGNDFLIAEQGHGPEVTPELAAQLCDRHFGVGGDGVLMTGFKQGSPFMKVINADGSVPEMCGNGLRCVALYLVHRGLLKERTFTVETDAGPHPVAVFPEGRVGQVRVSMRPASLDSSEVLSDGRGEFLDASFPVDGRELRVSAVSMGNPHAVIFDEIGDDAPHLGPRIEKDPRFRAGANVGFARMRDRSTIELKVWERGVGFTLACGTGACAAAVAAVETGRADRDSTLTVHLPGGPLYIRVGQRGERIEMTGPAREVFSGGTLLHSGDR